MDIVDGLRAFVATAQAGSFTAAADQLGVSNRLTSKYVAELEDRLGTRLLQRTTRRVGLTPAGETLLARAPEILDDLDEMLSDASEEARSVSGLVRVSAPVTFGETYIACMLGRYADAYPGIRIDLRLDDHYVDLATEGIDLAFRIGEGRAHAVKARKLGVMRVVLVASPEYLDRFGWPEPSGDFAGHQFIQDSNLRSPRNWVLKSGEREIGIDVEGSFLVNSARAACELAVMGRGIALSPMFACSDHLASGALCRVLPEYESEPSPVTAVYLEGRQLPRRTRALIDFAYSEMKQAKVV